MAFTYFFRDMQTLEVIRDKALPQMKTHQFIKVWDAGCAMGMEPYTLAIVLKENMSSMYFRNVRIVASDIDEGNRFEEIIKKGVYSKKLVERVPKHIFKTYFRPTEDGENVEVCTELRNAVIFKKHDLLSLKPIDTEFNLVLCKNVLLHFEHPDRLRVIDMFYRSIAPNGFIAFEQTQKMPVEFKAKFKQIIENAQIYQKICK